jgi:hypothetical protein
VLECRPFPGSHAHAEVKSIYDTILEEWGIKDEQVVACVTDNEATNNLVGDLLSSDWHGCIDHKLELVAKQIISTPGN